MAYLRVEKPCFLFLEGSTGAEAAVDVATVALPEASAARAASSVDRPAVDASAPDPGACSSTASATLGEGAAGSHLSGGPAPITLLLLLFLIRRRILRGCWGRESLLLTQPEFFVPLLPPFPLPDPSLLLARCPLLLLLLRRARTRARGISGSDHATFTVTLC
jgi:hypothetical protein